MGHSQYAGGSIGVQYVERGVAIDEQGGGKAVDGGKRMYVNSFISAAPKLFI